MYPNNYCELTIEITETLLPPINLFLKISGIPQTVPQLYLSQYAPTSQISSLTKAHISSICDPLLYNNVFFVNILLIFIDFIF